ncbi:MAG: type IV pilus modification protein PilV [Candidatus Thiodiazotropha sp.]
MKSQAHSLQKRYSRGMTLVEVLIAAVVIAIGLLGVASLQISALQGASDAQYRAKASDVIASLADRMRANLTAIPSYTGAIPVESCAIGPTSPMTTIERCAMSPDGTVAAVSQCTDAQMAAYDLWEINCALQATMPGAQLQITCPDAACPAMTPVTVTISWQVQNRNPSGGGVVAPDTFTTNEVVATILPGVQP